MSILLFLLDIYIYISLYHGGKFVGKKCEKRERERGERGRTFVKASRKNSKGIWGLRRERHNDAVECREY